MTRHTVARRAIFLAPLCALLTPDAAGAVAWPSRPIRMISPLPAGTLPDETMRHFADGLAERLGQKVVVENLPGGDGVVATTTFLNLNDDHAMFFSFGGPISVNPLTIADLPYDPAALAPLSSAALDHVAVATAPGLAVRDLAGLVALARAQPDSLTCVFAPGAISLAFDAFLAAEKLTMQHARYGTPAESWQEVAAGRAQVIVTPLASALPHVQAGRARLLAVTGAARAPAAPDVPTTAEQGFAHLAVQGFLGVFGRADMPAARQRQVSEAVRQVAATPATIRRLAERGQVAAGTTPEIFAALIAAQRAQVAAGLATQRGAMR
jgi:tripartite-type tricarboxylate transporter receptor subunit TctC